jgi:Mn-containing catalase
MKKINFYSDLLMEELAELLNAENQLIEALPGMVEASQSTALKLALRQHLQETREQAGRLQDVFPQGRDGEGNFCAAISMFIKDSEELIKRKDKSRARDTEIIRMAQRMEDYEITRYKMAREQAADFGHTFIVEVLTESLHEERAMKFLLNELAQYMINVQATDPKGVAQQT